MLGPLMPPIGPMGAASALSRRVNGDDSADAGVVGLLSEMADHVDSADWQLIVGAIVCAFSFSLFIGFGVLTQVMWKVHSAWYWLTAFFGLTFLLSTIYLVEPRPSHWLPALDNLCRLLGRFNPREWVARGRRWWKWRRKYESYRNTKLNV